MQSDRTIQSGDHTYAIRFGQNALYLLEEYLMQLQARGILAPRKYLHKDEKTGAQIEIDLPIDISQLRLLPPRMSCQVGLWVGLESARRFFKSRSQPFTLDEAAEIIDGGDFQAIENTVISAFMAAFPQRTEDSTEKPTEKNASGGTASTGTRRSSRPSKSASPSTSSGTAHPESTTS